MYNYRKKSTRKCSLLSLGFYGLLQVFKHTLTVTVLVESDHLDVARSAVRALRKIVYSIWVYKDDEPHELSPCRITAVTLTAWAGLNQYHLPVEAGKYRVYITECKCDPMENPDKVVGDSGDVQVPSKTHVLFDLRS